MVGLHRVINALPRGLQNDNVKAVIIVAGMDGALSTNLVAGLVDVPAVIAALTSIG